MNMLKKLRSLIWTKASDDDDEMNFLTLVHFNDSCQPLRNYLRRPSIREIEIDEFINELNASIEEYDPHFNRKMKMKPTFFLNFVKRKHSHALTVSELNLSLKKPMHLIPLKNIAISSKKIRRSRCLSNHSVKSAMASSKYKDSEFASRRTRCAVSVYLLDHLMESKRIEFLENTYGGKFVAHRSAKIIQRRFRQYVAAKQTKRLCSNLTNKTKYVKKTTPVFQQSSTSIDDSIDSIDSVCDYYNPDDPFNIDNDDNRKRIYFIGKNIFNKNCNKGINFLIKHGILESDGVSIVKFFSSQGLSSYAKGDFMSQDNNKLAAATRREFIAKMSFHNCSIESGVRQLFSKIRIPGETQKILNMLEEFHQVYLSQNAEIRKMLKKEDTVVLISFAILMVHTSLYNPSAAKQDRMTKEQFVKIFKGVNDEDFITEGYLNDLYDNIKKKQMKPLSDHTDLVRNIYTHLTGPLLPKDLIQNHRKLICQYNSNEIPNINKKPNSHAHFREIFLFNDLLLITKPVRSNCEFHVRYVIPLLGLKTKRFETDHYKFGIEIAPPESKKSLILLDCMSMTNREKLFLDIATYIEEVRQLDELRIGCEFERLNFRKSKKK